MKREITAALAGNPNIGKTTLLNALTGARYTVGNWSGVTVEKKEAKFNYKDTTINLVDLPGTYSLSALSLDESIARDYIVKENPDIILNLVDASNLERNLYLTLQLLELGKPVVMVLNMMDVAEAQGTKINLAKLSSLLDIPIIPIVAAKKTGLDDLLKTITNDKVLHKTSTYKVTYEDEVVDEMNKITSLIHTDGLKLPTHWLALKILEGDASALNYVSETEQVILKQYIDESDFSLVNESIIHSKYTHIASIVKEVVTMLKATQTTWTDKIDKYATHRFWGFPIFIAVMCAVFIFTFNLVGTPLTDLFDSFFSYVLELCNNGLMALGISDWIRALVVEGALNGVFGVLTFLPNIAALFIALTILEDTGYMARVAFIMDELMKKLGLNGKAIIPMLLGFGCNVPAIMGTRTIEDENDRLTSILINPFFSCSARLPIYTLFASAFFPGKEGLIVASLYFLGIVVALVIAFIFKKTLFKSDSMPFIMELPKYHLPNLKNTALQVWEKVRGFLIKAGTTIFVASVFLWFILNFNFSGPVDMADSLGASIGHFIAPLFAPLGFGNWQAALSLIAGVVGKEIVVSNMAIVYGLGEVATASNFHQALDSSFTPLSAYAFLVFTLLYIPCVGTLGAIKRETNSLKWVTFSVIFQVAVAWIVSFLVMCIGQLFI